MEKIEQKIEIVDAAPAQQTKPLTLSKKIKFTLEFIPLKTVSVLLRILPYPISIALGRALGRFIGTVIGSRQKIARKNIIESLPNLKTKEVDQIISGCWAHLGQTAAEFSKIATMKKEDYFSIVETEGSEMIDSAYKAGRGVLLLTAHFGAWEFAGQFLPFSGYRAAVIARRIKNPYVNDFVNRERTSHGNKVFLARNAVRESIRWLKHGNILVMLIDHRITEGGLEVPLFGRDAGTTSLPAILALRYSIPTFMVCAVRKNGKIKIIFSQVNLLDLIHQKDEIFLSTLRMNQVLEDWIRKDPEQWLWIHNRWKK